jgi:hypothetical protein
MVDDPVGEDDVVRVPIVGISGGILPDSGVGAGSQGRSVGEVEPEPVGTVGSGIVLRLPRTGRSVGLPEFARGKRLPVDEADVGEIAGEIPP